MKQSPSNSGDPPSASTAGENLCFSGGPNFAALNVLADGGISYLLPYVQFLFAAREPNPALEKEPDAPPEKMLIHFAQAEVVVLGSGLKRLETCLQQYELKFVKSVDRRLAAALNSHVGAIIVTFIRENV